VWKVPRARLFRAWPIGKDAGDGAIVRDDERAFRPDERAFGGVAERA